MSQRITRISWLALALCLACRTTAPGSEAQPTAAAASSPSVPAPGAPSALHGPQAALDALDQRQPVPLLPMMAQHQKENMRQHLEAVQEVVAAVAVGDFAQVAAAAKRMGYSDAMGRMCEHMGAGAPGFTAQALSFHHIADEIAQAATNQDQAAVLAALSKTLRACTSCHQTYKQQLVSSLTP